MGDNYYITDGTSTLGPYTPQQLLDFLSRGELGPHVLFCREGNDTWQPISSTFFWQPPQEEENQTVDSRTTLPDPLPAQQNVAPIGIFAPARNKQAAASTGTHKNSSSWWQRMVPNVYLFPVFMIALFLGIAIGLAGIRVQKLIERWKVPRLSGADLKLFGSPEEFNTAVRAEMDAALADGRSFAGRSGKVQRFDVVVKNEFQKFTDGKFYYVSSVQSSEHPAILKGDLITACDDTPFQPGCDLTIVVNQKMGLTHELAIFRNNHLMRVNANASIYEPTPAEIQKRRLIDATEAVLDTARLRHMQPTTGVLNKAADNAAVSPSADAVVGRPY
jgi:hypothetical protein